MNGCWEHNQKYFYCHAIINFPLLESNNKLKHSLPSVALYINVCVFVYECFQIPLATRHELWQFKDRFPEKPVLPPPFLPVFTHPLPFELRYISLALPLKPERRHTGWTGRTNSSHALWLLDGILFSTQVLEGYSESAFLVINKASAGFHLEYLNMP